MEAGLIEKLGGVGALIINAERDSFLTIKELRTKRSTHKLANQRSSPWETIKPGETRRETFGRLQTEEIQILDFDLWDAHWDMLGMIEIAEGVVLHAAFFELPRDVEIRLGTEVTEVNDPRWIPLKEAMEEPPQSFRFRPGVYETVHLYDTYRKPNPFIPEICRFSDLRHKIPAKVFDLIEGGISAKEALSQLGHVWQPEVGIPSLAPLQSQPLSP